MRIIAFFAIFNIIIMVSLSHNIGCRQYRPVSDEWELVGENCTVADHFVVSVGPLILDPSSDKGFIPPNSTLVLSLLARQEHTYPSSGASLNVIGISVSLSCAHMRSVVVHNAETSTDSRVYSSGITNEVLQCYNMYSQGRISYVDVELRVFPSQCGSPESCTLLVSEISIGWKEIGAVAM